MTIPDEAVRAAQDAFNKTINDPSMVPCSRCSGKGYHHGFGEDGASPDWCIECGGSAFDVVPGEEERAMRAALTAALPFLTGVKVKELEWSNDADMHGDEWLCSTETLPSYTIIRWWLDDNRDEVGHFEVEGLGENQFGTLEAAKAAAQADYEARIRSAIETVIPVSAPSPRAQALEEAAKIAFDVSENGEYHGEASVDSTSSIYQQGAFEVYEAIRALSSQPVADGWSPIETAPKDPNTVILVLLPSMMNLIVRARYNSVHGYWITDCDNDGRISKPTFFHPGDMWHPMPALPASPGASE